MTNSFMEQEKVFVGIQAAVLYKNEIILNKGFGYTDIENKKPFLNNTIVALGSNTKELTSVAVQLLHNKALIGYDNKTILFDHTHENYAEYRLSQGAGAVGGSLADFTKWHTAILTSQLLPMKNINQMITPCTLNNGQRFIADH
jgi:hypothetical protein